MYDRIKHDIEQDYYRQNYPNDGQRFVAWYLRNIHGLDPAEAKGCVTDGAGDKQIDAVYVNDQEETIYIIQGKYYAGNIDSGPLMEIIASWIQIKDLRHLQENANDKLKAKISEISSALEDNYTVCFELITATELTEAAKNDAERFTAELASSNELSANLVVVDKYALEARYNESLNRNRHRINHQFQLVQGIYMDIVMDDTRVVIAILPLSECIKIPGIQDGSLFRRNVRQSLGMGVKVNKDIAATVRNNPREFFFQHNGITAVCSSLNIDDNDILTVKDLSVVNGCQSLTAINSSSEAVREDNEGYIMFRFYEISDGERSDVISTSTNSQSAVSARDLRSNDRYVLAMKRAYEQYYTDGYFITKRGETLNTAKYNINHTVDLTSLGKQLIAWHSQRPTNSYSENKIFDKYFEQLFHRSYSPENINALSEIFRGVYDTWKTEKSNPLGFNEALLAMKSFAPYHHFFAVSIVFCEINNAPDSVPEPSEVLRLMKTGGLFGTVIEIAGQCLNTAFEVAMSCASGSSEIFSPPNWIKSKASLNDIRASVRQYFMMAKMGDKKTVTALINALKMKDKYFSPRWTAD